MTESADDLRREARRRLKAKQEFFTVISVFAVVSIVLVVIWSLTSPGGYFWPMWPLLGMGVAALFVGLNAFGPISRHITEADVDAEIERMNRRR